LRHARQRHGCAGNDPEFRERAKQQARENNKIHSLRKRNGRLKSEFGITQEDYDRILASQNGCCAICGARENKVNHSRPRKFLYVDHDHKTGKVRGILCHNCNFAIGYFKDDPERMRRAADYLDSF
jgi:ribosomal protein L34E